MKHRPASRRAARSPCTAPWSAPRRRRPMAGTGDGPARERRVRADQRAHRQRDRGLRPAGIDGRLTRRRLTRPAATAAQPSPGTESDRLASQGSLVVRPSGQAPARGQRRQRHRLGLPRPRPPARARDVVPSGGQFPASIARPRRPRLRPQRGRHRDRPGLPDRPRTACRRSPARPARSGLPTRPRRTS